MDQPGGFTPAQDLAVRLVRDQSNAVREALENGRASAFGDWGNGYTCAVLTAVQVAFGFTIAETEKFILIIVSGDDL